MLQRRRAARGRHIRGVDVVLDDDRETGEGASLKNNEAQGNGGVAYRIAANAGSYESNTAVTNHDDGFLITGNNNTFTGNTAEHNDGVGFNVPGPGIGNHFNTNAANINDGAGELVIAPGQTGDGNKTNKSNGKVFSIPPEGGTINYP